MNKRLNSLKFFGRGNFLLIVDFWFYYVIMNEDKMVLEFLLLF